MALFSKNTKTVQAKKATPAAKKEVHAVSSHVMGVHAHVLRGPRITEKASDRQAAGVYTFDIAENATKRDVMRAVQSLYKVSPRAVRIVPVPAKMKRSMRTGRVGVTPGGRKAYVYLKSGDSITIA